MKNTGVCFLAGLVWLCLSISNIWDVIYILSFNVFNIYINTMTMLFKLDLIILLFCL